MQRVAEFHALGTRWNIDAPKALAANVVDVLDSVQRRLDAFEHVYSRFRSDSLVTKISQRAGRYAFPVDALALFAWYRTLYDATNGLVTPLIGRVLSDAGYDRAYSLVEKPMTSPRPWDDVMTWDVRTCTLTTSEPIHLDFGAAGKGHAVDIVASMLLAAGVTSFLVNAGGDICQRGQAGERSEIALENPHDMSQAVGVATIVNQSICGSSGSRRHWGRFHHTLNPVTLSSPQELSALWVVADSTMIADGLTTALQFAMPDKLISNPSIPSFEFAVLNPSLALAASPSFPGHFFHD